MTALGDWHQGDSEEFSRFLAKSNRLHGEVHSDFGKMMAGPQMMIIDHFLHTNPQIARRIQDYVVTASPIVGEYIAHEIIFTKLLEVCRGVATFGDSLVMPNNPQGSLYLFGNTSTEMNIDTGLITRSIHVGNISVCDGKALALLPQMLMILKQRYRKYVEDIDSDRNLCSKTNVEMIVNVDASSPSGVMDLISCDSRFIDRFTGYVWDPKDHPCIGEITQKYDARTLTRNDLGHTLYNAFKQNRIFDNAINLPEVFEQLAKRENVILVTERSRIVGIFPQEYSYEDFLGLSVPEGRVGVVGDFMNLFEPTVDRPELLHTRALAALHEEINKPKLPCPVAFDVSCCVPTQELPPQLPATRMIRKFFSLWQN